MNIECRMPGAGRGTPLWTLEIRHPISDNRQRLFYRFCRACACKYRPNSGSAERASVVVPDQRFAGAPVSCYNRRRKSDVGKRRKTSHGPQDRVNFLLTLAVVTFTVFKEPLFTLTAQPAAPKGASPGEASLNAVKSQKTNASIRATDGRTEPWGR